MVHRRERQIEVQIPINMHVLPRGSPSRSEHADPVPPKSLAPRARIGPGHRVGTRHIETEGRVDFDMGVDGERLRRPSSTVVTVADQVLVLHGNGVHVVRERKTVGDRVVLIRTPKAGCVALGLERFARLRRQHQTDHFVWLPPSDLESCIIVRVGYVYHLGVDLLGRGRSGIRGREGEEFVVAFW